MMIKMYDKDNKKEETIVDILAIALLFAIIQIIGMVICMMIFQNNLIISIIIMLISNLIMYKLVLN
ncbi:hypothetical protein [Peptacetobacter sp.]|uniref:hypothetical protein n=1 Tax=Peptacetobacter sp. TaxID=2991975 RepID=UPI00260DC9CF|nr:hypothetical protein [Peptacetobacter sp.]